jgi:hypothetical protein
MPEVADIFRRYGPDYLQRFGPNLLPSHRKVLADLVDCRTPVLGGQLYQCNSCGKDHYVYHSCRNRSCPKCHAADTAAWIERRRQELLPVGYFHVGFTLPQELRPIARANQKLFYGLMPKAAAGSLIKLAADPHYVGGLHGVMAVLHTWARTLAYHPHVHCLVPAGSVFKDEHWHDARPGFLVPVTALSKIFRGMLRDELTAALPDVQFPPSLWRRDWVVYCKPAIQGTDKVLEYLARYVHRIAITNSRILSIDNGQVAFRYKPTDESAWKTMTVTADEFIRRFLLHVLPAGVHKVRYYGLWAPAHRPLLRRVQLALLNNRSSTTTLDSSAASLLSPAKPPAAHDSNSGPPVRAQTVSVRPGIDLQLATCRPSRPPIPCPFCSTGTLLFLRRIPPQSRAPP